MRSLQARLLIVASVVLVVFLGLIGAGLDRAFRQSALGAVRARLQAQVYLLLSAAEVDPNGGVRMPELLPEARFSTPGSGLYAEINAGHRGPSWRSQSMLGLDVPFPTAPDPGDPVFAEVFGSDGKTLFSLSFTVIWEAPGIVARRYTFRVAESRNTFDTEVRGFRRSLWAWFALASIALLVVQGLLLRWSLAPLRQVTRELAEIEGGRRCELTTAYPEEIQQLTGNLNALIRHSREHLGRYRNAMGDLAHSLKTPLAVLRGAVESAQGLEDLQGAVAEQVQRMDQTVQYQLQRAAASGRTTLATPVSVETVTRQVVASLVKVYRKRPVQYTIEVAPNAVFYGDQGDLMEVLGNITDNAFKWSRSRIILRAHPTMKPAQGRSGLVIEVEDDGAGIPAVELRAILQRGVRADPHTAGHGIGLAVIQEIVEEIYRGHLTIGRGPLGGARVRVEFM